MLFEDLATELVVQVFLSCSTVTDVTTLSSTCKRFRNIYTSSQKLLILENAAETQFGPLDDLAQLLTHNASQPAHIARSVPFSLALLKQIVQHGRVAEKWSDMYPFKKWKHNYESRRLLTTEERYRVRRAIYRIWLYSRAFHNSDHPRESRATRLVLLRRATLLHNWSTWDLADIADLHSVMREVVQNNPFNPLTPIPLSMHFNNTNTYTSRYTASKYSLHASHEVGAEGWGDDIPHYYVVEDYLKLDPAQILYLKEKAPLKGMVEGYIKSLCPEYDWFTNNGETWVQTLEFVLEERGEHVREFLRAIENGELGIAVE